MITFAIDYDHTRKQPKLRRRRNRPLPKTTARCNRLQPLQCGGDLAASSSFESYVLIVAILKRGQERVTRGLSGHASQLTQARLGIMIRHLLLSSSPPPLNLYTIA
jgi:hypothetical protein